MLSPKQVIIAVCCVIALVVSAYLVSRYYFDQSREEATPAVTTDKTGPTAKGHGDVGHEKSHPPVETQTEPSPPSLHTERPMTIEEYEKQRAQYSQDYLKWASKYTDLAGERMRRSHELARIWPSPEEVASMSEEEAHKVAKRMIEQLDRIAEVDKELDSVNQEKPILPPPPKTK